MLVNCLRGGPLGETRPKLTLLRIRNIYKGGITCIKTSVATAVQKECWGRKDLGEAVSFGSTLNAFLFHAYDSII